MSNPFPLSVPRDTALLELSAIEDRFKCPTDQQYESWEKAERARTLREVGMICAAQMEWTTVPAYEAGLAILNRVLHLAREIPQ